MHTVIPSTRHIAPADLPQARDLDTGALRACTDQELLDRGMYHIGDDLYSCIHQLRSDDEEAAATGKRTWAHAGTPIPGTVLATGNGRQRYDTLPDDVRAKALRAVVIRATAPESNALTFAQANLAEQAAAIDENVGTVTRENVMGLVSVGDPLQPVPATVEGLPLVDLSTPDALLAEGERLAGMPDSGIERMTVRMADVDASADIVHSESLVPHLWAGERG